jgi:hypothetical protein
MGTIRSGPLILFVDTGSVYLHISDGDDERLGHIDDPEACPFGHDKHWAWLAGEMEDRRRFGDACAATAMFSYYDRLSPAHWN